MHACNSETADSTDSTHYFVRYSTWWIAPFSVAWPVLHVKDCKVWTSWTTMSLDFPWFCLRCLDRELYTVVLGFCSHANRQIKTGIHMANMIDRAIWGLISCGVAKWKTGAGFSKSSSHEVAQCVPIWWIWSICSGNCGAVPVECNRTRTRSNGSNW